MATVYLNGQYLPDSQALISPLDRGFTYGDGVYEVIRAWNGKPFLLTEHFNRLADSCAKMRIGAYLTHLEDVPDRLLKENGLTAPDSTTTPDANLVTLTVNTFVSASLADLGTTDYVRLTLSLINTSSSYYMVDPGGDD